MLLFDGLINSADLRIWGMVVLLVVGGCAPTPPKAATTDRADIQARFVPVHHDTGYFTEIAWPRANSLVVGFAAHPQDPGGSALQIWQLRPDGTEFHQISLPTDRNCRRTKYRSPTPLHDGRVALVKICELPLGPGPSATYSILAYDLYSGTAREIVRPQDKLNPGPFSFNPEVSRAVVASGSGICSSIGWLTQDGPQPLAITMGSGNRTWSLDEAFEQGPEQDCTNQGRADLPSWSPDGNEVAFFVSPESIGLSGSDRLRAPWELYLMNPVKQQPRKVLSDVSGPSAPIWSPDGRWITFSATLKRQGAGTWLFEPATGKLRRITTKDYDEALTWSPDGRRLAGVRFTSPPSQYPPTSEIVLYDLTSILK
jgi:WD40-like Beta Propeller Repeat